MDIINFTETQKLYLVFENGAINEFYSDHVKKSCFYENYIKEIIFENFYESQPENISHNKIYYKTFFAEFLNLKHDQLSNYNIMSSDDVEILYREFVDYLNLNLPNITVKAQELKVTTKNFEVIEKTYFEETSNVKDKYYLLLHCNLINIIIDYLILKNFTLEKNFRYILGERPEYFISNQIKCQPKNIIIFSPNLEKIYEYKKLGTWTAFISKYVITTFHKEIKQKKSLKELDRETSIFQENFNDQHYIMDLGKANKNFLIKYGRFFDFASLSFNSLNNYFQYIIEINLQSRNENNANTEKLKAKIKEINPVRVMILVKNLFKYREFLRGFEYYKSDNEIFYQSYCGADEEQYMALNGEFDVVFCKLTRDGELKYFENLLKTINDYISKNPQIYNANNLENMDYFNDRGKMIDILNQVVKKGENITKQHKTNIIVPRSNLVRLENIDTTEKFKNFLKENNLNLPIILKLTGPGENFDHLMSSIVSEKGIDNYISHIVEFGKNDINKIEILVQSFFNHGGKVIKSYYLNGKAHNFLRPSLPDMKEEYSLAFEEFKNGYFNFYTSDLVSKKFENIWSQLHIEQNLEQIIDYEYLNKMCKIFELESNKTLFGLDFLYNKEMNEYSLIDCNYFPGYKEFKGIFAPYLKEHILNYYSQFKSNHLIS